MSLRRKRAPSKRAKRRPGHEEPADKKKAKGMSSAVVREQVLMIFPEEASAEDQEKATQYCFGCVGTRTVVYQCDECGVLMCQGCGDENKVCLCRHRIRYLDGTYGELDTPPTVLHNFVILEESKNLAHLKAMADERQEQLKKDAVKQERKQLLAGLKKLEKDENAPVHWAYAMPCQDAGDRHELAVGSRVIYSLSQEVLTVIGHGPHGTYNLAKVDYSEIHFCVAPPKVRAMGAVGLARAKRAAPRAEDSGSS